MMLGVGVLNASSACGASTKVSLALAGAAGTVAWLASGDLPLTVEGQIQKRILLMEKSMNESKTWEQFLTTELQQVSGLVEELQEGLDRISQTPDLNERLQRRLKESLDQFAVVLRETLHFGPKVRKMCLSRQLGAKFLKKAVHQLDSSGAVDLGLLEKVTLKLMPDADLEISFQHITERLGRVASDLDSIAKEILDYASFLRQMARDAAAGADEKLRGCVPGMGTFEFLCSFASAVGIVSGIVLAIFSSPCWAIAAGCGGVGGVLTFYRCRRNARKHAQCRDERDAAEAQRQHEEERAQRLDALRKLLGDASSLIGPQNLQALHDIIKGLLMDLGVDTHYFQESMEVLDGGLTKQLEDYIEKNQRVLTSVAHMEAVTLKALGVLMGRSPEMQLNPFFCTLLTADRFVEGEASEWEGKPYRISSSVHCTSSSSAAALPESSGLPTVDRALLSQSSSSGLHPVELRQGTAGDHSHSRKPADPPSEDWEQVTVAEAVAEQGQGSSSQERQKNGLSPA